MNKIIDEKSNKITEKKKINKIGGIFIDMRCSM